MYYLEIKLWKCQNSTSKTKAEAPGVRPGVVCEDRNTIDEYFRKEKFSFAFINTMFALDDFENPLQPFIDDQLFFELDPTVSKRANFFIQKQVATLEDDIMQIGQSEELEFHQVLNVKSYEDDYNDADGTVLAVYMRADKFYDSYERKVTDILTLLGDIGGLKEFFIACGMLIVGYISQRIFMSNIVKKIYQIRKYENI